MKELTEIATRYAEEKTNEVMVNAIAKAYADGYCDGYKDREEEIPVNLRKNKTEYIDLGLPSGTLWATDFEKEDDGKAIFLPYQQAVSEYMSLPTKEQWQELLEICKWHGDYTKNYQYFYGAVCIGPNGNSIKFSSLGYMRDDSKREKNVWFWLSDNEESNEKNSVRLSDDDLKLKVAIKKTFCGYKLPIRLVRTK